MFCGMRGSVTSSLRQNTTTTTSSCSSGRKAEKQKGVFYIFHHDGHILVLAEFTGTTSLFRKYPLELFSCHLNFFCTSNFGPTVINRRGKFPWLLASGLCLKNQSAKLCKIICWLVIGCQSAAEPLCQHTAVRHFPPSLNFPLTRGDLARPH